MLQSYFRDFRQCFLESDSCKKLILLWFRLISKLKTLNLNVPERIQQVDQLSRRIYPSSVSGSR
ncbi:hypothetical protein CJO75_12635 [Ralstonia solanacearum]|nr:hypothetical protein CJO75_12635 [Ralstonia solanacearum]AXW15591.1 hypothetical protein CJO84_12840 [Ralstonia solanacearum]AXW39139.1 hypothetical protein CJO89_13210 [Ralstonia solanacearum]AXW71922.1 hypothetical protein CJO96_12670 [Ralstonia solanacearum]